MTQLDKDVEQRFDEEFPGLANYDDKTDTWGNYKIKQFLAQEIQRAKEEGAREAEQKGYEKGMVRVAKKCLVEKGFLSVGLAAELEELTQLTHPLVKEI